MIGLTPVFHIFSLVSLFALIWWISSLAHQRTFARRLWRYSRNKDLKEVWVDWPHRFMHQFCFLCGAEFALTGKQNKPCRIAPGPWIDVDRLAQIKKVVCDGQTVFVYVSSDIEDEQCLWAADLLAQSFNGDWTVKVLQSS